MCKLPQTVTKPPRSFKSRAFNGDRISHLLVSAALRSGLVYRGDRHGVESLFTHVGRTRTGKNFLESDVVVLSQSLDDLHSWQ